MTTELTKITPKQQAYIALADKFDALKVQQNEVLSGLVVRHYDTIQGIPSLEAEIREGKAIVTMLQEGRSPLTKMLDDLKSKTMLAEKEGQARIQVMQANLLDLKRELSQQEAATKAKLDAERKAREAAERERLNEAAAYANEIKTIIDKAVTIWPLESWTIEKYIAQVEARIKLVPGGDATDRQDACEIFRNALQAKIEGMDANKVTDAIIDRVEDQKEAAVIENAIAAQQVDEIKLVETKDLKHVYELDMPDDESTLRAVLIAWLKYFNDVTSGLRNRSMMTVKIDQAVASICKLRQEQEIEGLVFKVVEKL